MQISASGLLFIKEEEGFQSVPHLDTNKMCWGYGHNRIGNEPIPSSISLSDAEAQLRRDVQPHEVRVNQLAPWANQHQFDSLVDFAFNAGDASLARLLAHGEAQVPAEMSRWVHADIDGQSVVLPALVARRGREAALFNTPVEHAEGT